MTTELMSRSQSTKYPRVLGLKSASPFSQLMQQAYNRVARRAYELYENRGREDGHDLEDWFRAEAEVLNARPVEIREVDDQITVRAQVPGLSEEDIAVRVAPRRLVVTGKWEHILSRKKNPIERSPNAFLRILDLPEAIDPKEVKAAVCDGTLEVQMKKAKNPPGRSEAV